VAVTATADLSHLVDRLRVIAARLQAIGAEAERQRTRLSAA